MTKKTTLKPVAAVVGAALVGGLTALDVAADENPFGASQMKGGYMQLASSEEGSAGKEMEEGKCGGEKQEAEGKCGEGKDVPEGKDMPEGKCGEGKCGNME